jgi:hypothetical protein
MEHKGISCLIQITWVANSVVLRSSDGKARNLYILLLGKSVSKWPLKEERWKDNMNFRKMGFEDLR